MCPLAICRSSSTCGTTLSRCSRCGALICMGGKCSGLGLPPCSPRVMHAADSLCNSAACACLAGEPAAGSSPLAACCELLASPWQPFTLPRHSTLLLVSSPLQFRPPPSPQRYIVRIIFMVPMYSICSFPSLIHPNQAIYWNTVRDWCVAHGAGLGAKVAGSWAGAWCGAGAGSWAAASCFASIASWLASLTYACIVNRPRQVAVRCCPAACTAWVALGGGPAGTLAQLHFQRATSLLLPPAATRPG